MSPKLQPSQHGPFTGGVAASLSSYEQPPGTVPRASNLIGIARGALSTCDGSSIHAWESGGIQINDDRFLAMDVFQPSGVAPYYLALKQTNAYPLGPPYGASTTPAGTGGGTPATVAFTAGCPQIAAVNTAFGTQFQATVLDSTGTAVSGVQVLFTAPTSGQGGTFPGGATSATAFTGANGVAIAPVFTANGTPGSYTITASVPSILGATCNLTNSSAPAPASITISAGCGRSTLINSVFSTPLQATVLDSSGTPVAQATVLFTVPAAPPVGTPPASGTFAIGGNTSTATTNSQGIATASQLTANGTPGSFTVTAQVGNLTASGTCTLTNVSSGGGGGASLTILTTMLPGAVAGNLGEFYSAYVEASGQGGTWAISGLPSYLSWAVANSGGNTALVNISGTPPIQAGPTPPADLGTFNVTISLTSGGGTNTVTLPLTVADSSAPVVPATVVPITNFGNVGAGGDDTSIFQTALNSTAAAGQALHIVYNSAHAGIPYNVGPLTIPNGSYLTFDGTVTINATAGYGTNDCMLTVGSNVVISGASTVFDMSLNQVSGTEFRHCCLVQGSNVYISGCTFSQAGGDGIYVHNSSNVMFVSCTCNQNYRNGCSITDNASHIFFERCNFQNTAGTAPQSGVDVEPNGGSASPVDINFYTCNCTGNAVDGFLVSLQNLISSSGVVSVFVQNMHASNNGGTSGQKYGFGYHLLNAGQGTVNPPGQVWIQNSFSDNSNSYGATARFWGADGVQATFVNLSVTNPNLGGPDFDYGDKSAVTIIRGGGESTPMGNARFGVYFPASAPGPYTLPGVSVNAQTSPTVATDYYFNIQDGSGQTLEHITVILESVTGASRPNGYYGVINGTGQTTTQVYIP